MAELAIAGVAALAITCFLAYHRRKSARQERRRVISKRLQTISDF